MATRYHCTHGDLELLIGGFHGGRDDCQWVEGSCCPDCGSQHCLQRPMFDADALDRSFTLGHRAPPYVPKAATLRGPKGEQTLLLDSRGAPSALCCQQCGAGGRWCVEGPFSGGHPGEPARAKPSAEMRHPVSTPRCFVHAGDR